MAKIKVETVCRQFGINGDVKISSPEFLFKNTGECSVMIDDVVIVPGDYWGHSVDNAAALILKGVEIERRKTYRINFLNHDTTDQNRGGEVVPGMELRKTLVITETFYNVL